jgi:PBP1b-binding outer membrane lipoprotein LpoB
MKTLILSLAIFLSGCAMFQKPVPVAPQWPAAPEALRKKCDELKVVAGEKISITDMMKVIVENYSLHYQCAAKVDGWNEWYEEQKKTYETVVPDKKGKPWYKVWGK